MTSPQAKLEASGEMIVFTLTGRNEENAVGHDLAALVGRLRRGHHVLLDCARVRFITSMELGEILGLHKELKALGGRLTLFNVGPEIYEVFGLTKLHRVLEICRQSLPNVAAPSGRQP